MDRALPSNREVLPGVSIRNGPVQEVDTTMADANGVDMNGGPVKRKGRESLTRPSYVDVETSEEDDKPLVRTAGATFCSPVSVANTDSEQAPKDHDRHKGPSC